MTHLGSPGSIYIYLYLVNAVDPGDLSREPVLRDSELAVFVS